jgi:hypothetical protein
MKDEALSLQQANSTPANIATEHKFLKNEEKLK